MMDPDARSPDAALNAALDAALAHAMIRPPLPAGFRGRLRAALERSAAVDAAAQRRALQQEHEEELSTLHSEFIRLRRRTLGTLVGVAFCTGAGVAVAMPWIMRGFGSAADLVVPTLGAALGVGIGLVAWLRRDSLANWSV